MAKSRFPVVPGRDPVAQAGESAAGRPLGDAERTADYIAQMSAELAVMAKDAGFDLLAYLLDMARLEARQRRSAAEGERR